LFLKKSGEEIRFRQNDRQATMLSKTFEFLRIADVQPSAEKVKLRTQSARDSLALVDAQENRDVLLALLQGVIGGFEKAPFTQESPVVALIIKAIKDQDAAFPNDLKENATELRALAAIVVGEILVRSNSDRADEVRNITALAIRSALSLRPQSGEKHFRWALETLLSASDQVLQAVALQRRKRGNAALKAVNKMKETTAATDLWGIVAPKVKAALLEAAKQSAVDREELETLWWLFGGFSELKQQPLLELSPSAAAFCSGFELAERALIPPSVSAAAMVKRATEMGRKSAVLVSMPLQDAMKDWSAEMFSAMAPADGICDDTILKHPALFPVGWACHRLRDSKGTPKLGKEFTVSTGIPSDHAHAPAEWGIQVFREKILLRILTEEES
jgi:hypothetical protein